MDISVIVLGLPIVLSLDSRSVVTSSIIWSSSKSSRVTAFTFFVARHNISSKKNVLTTVEGTERKREKKLFLLFLCVTKTDCAITKAMLPVGKRIWQMKTAWNCRGLYRRFFSMLSARVKNWNPKWSDIEARLKFLKWVNDLGMKLIVNESVMCQEIKHWRFLKASAFPALTYNPVKWILLNQKIR